MEDNIPLPVDKSELDEAELEQTSGGVAGKTSQSKLSSQNSAIDAGMIEASQKASNVMNAAATSITTGIIGGIIQKASS